MDAQASTVSAFLDHFSSIAASYRAFRPTYPPQLATWLASQAPGRALAWDAGCGSGQFSRPLAAAFERVLATDASAQQLAQAEPVAGVEFRCAPAERSGLPDACADLVAVAQAAHWFDLGAFYAEARRVGCPGAVIALICYGHNSVGTDLDELVRHYANSTAGPYWPPERAAVDCLYRSFPFPFRELHAPAFALEERWDLAHFSGYVATWSATRRLSEERGPEPFDNFLRNLARAWGDPQTERSVRWPLGLRAGILP